jgi:hypothetical protein
MMLNIFFCQFPNPWTLRVSGMGGYTSKCEKKPKSLHPNAHPPARYRGKGHSLAREGEGESQFRRGDTRWRERGRESPNSDEGTYTVVLCIYKYFVDLANNEDLFGVEERELSSQNI